MYRHLRSAGVRRIFWLGYRTNSHIQYKVPHRGHTHFCASTLIKNVNHTVYLTVCLNCMASIAIDKTWLIRTTFPRFPQDTSKSTAKLYCEGIPSTKITIRLTTCTQHTKTKTPNPKDSSWCHSSYIYLWSVVDRTMLAPHQDLKWGCMPILSHQIRNQIPPDQLQHQL